MPPATSPLPSSSASPLRISGPSLDVGDILEQNGGAGAVRADRNILEILDILNISAAPDHVFDPGKFEDPPLDIPVALPDRIHDLGERDVIGKKPIGVDRDLILLDKAADARDLGDALDAFEGELDGVVLDGAELCQVIVARFIDQGVLESPAEARRIGTEHRIDIGGEFVPDRLDVLEDPAPGPVDIRSLFEDHIDKGTAEIGKTPHRLDLGGGEQGRGDRVGDLVFDQIGAASGPFGVDDHLGVAQVGEGVQRRSLQRPVSPENQKGHEQEDDKPVAGTVFDYSSDHRGYRSVLCRGGYSLQLRLRIDQEIGRRGHLFAGIDPHR